MNISRKAIRGSRNSINGTETVIKVCKCGETIMIHIKKESYNIKALGNLQFS